MQAPENRRAPLRTKLLIAAAALLGLALAGELAARAYLANWASESAFRRFASIDQLQRDERFPSAIQRHSYMSYMLTPGFKKGPNEVDSHGFRGAEVLGKKREGEFRIFCMGGSTTYGGGIPDWRLAYPAQLEVELEKRVGGDIVVINAAAPGYTSWESVTNFAFRVLEYEPDLVLVYDGVNDILARFVWPPEGYRSDNSAFRKPSSVVYWPKFYEQSALARIVAIQLGWTMSHSRLERLFGGGGEDNVDAAAAAKLGVPLERILAANPPKYFERNLENVGVLARHHGCRAVFLTFAHCTGFPGQLGSDTLAFEAAYREMNEAARRAAERSGAAVFEFAAVLPDDRALFLDAVHLSPRGCELQARLIADFLIANRLVPGS
ncbi:MAG: SGNH/GDSL hydrolase family protein [Planctomycetes bacterium]|nr:SGNH/GDSL hydrolase family protein [Planctomycetota bacterium]